MAPKSGLQKPAYLSPAGHMRLFNDAIAFIINGNSAQSFNVTSATSQLQPSYKRLWQPRAAGDQPVFLNVSEMFKKHKTSMIGLYSRSPQRFGAPSTIWQLAASARQINAAPQSSPDSSRRRLHGRCHSSSLASSSAQLKCKLSFTSKYFNIYNHCINKEK